MERQKINKLAVKLSKDAPGSPEYLRCYNAARKKVEEKLTDEQRQNYRAMAKQWSEKKLPPMMQRRYVHGSDSSRLELTDFSTLV